MTRGLRRLALAAMLSTLLAAQSSLAQATPSISRVYCYSVSYPGVKIFAARTRRGGLLDFGVSIWDHKAQNIGAFGTARRRGDHWEYVDFDRYDRPPDNRCRLLIWLPRDGSVRLATPDPKATCGAWGGLHTSLDGVRFRRADIQKRVTFELDDSETFLSDRVGACAKGESPARAG